MKPLFYLENIGEYRRLCKENRLSYVVRNQYKPNNHPIYVVDTNLGSSMFFNDAHIEQDLLVVEELKEDKEFSKRKEALQHKKNEQGLRAMYFDGFISKEGDGAGIWIISPNRGFKVYYYKLAFECANNVEKYEALLLGLNCLKDLKEKIIDVFGDS